eukprot:CAMPEP_0168341494 /NCGR_PEP_ID=MMETSP0213-20121227/14731_1 /TAXON_ID=151035 /ORGANISM="Euplotes harpa, Strain FSP1.4" /LENGTH=60 /DNA_ID=CAMNT_0008348009 /DNA_START=1 /DNA_END=180 /DNA_ORIENTATION=+
MAGKDNDQTPIKKAKKEINQKLDEYDHTLKPPINEEDIIKRFSAKRRQFFQWLEFKDDLG